MSPGDGLPVSRITEIVSASSLSDDDIQQLMSTLLEQMNTNSEWEAVSLSGGGTVSLSGGGAVSLSGGGVVVTRV